MPFTNRYWNLANFRVDDPSSALSRQGKLDASVISDPDRPIKARAIASAPVGPLNLFKPGACKVVPKPQKRFRTGRHFNRAGLNSRK